MTLKTIIRQFLAGFKDSIIGCIRFFNKQKILESNVSAPVATRRTPVTDNKSKLRQRLVQSCILNGVFLLLCILVFNFMVMPSLNWISSKFLNAEYNNAIIEYMNPIINMVFSFVWIIPVFMLSKIFNVFWHQDIADIAYFQNYGRPKTYQKFTITEVFADTIFSCSMELVFVIQSSLISFLPFYWLTFILCQVHLSFLYSLYAFEYKWCNKGWNIERRIYHIETRWPYFIGFGLSLSIMVSLVNSYIIGATLFASVFPVFILSAIESDSDKLKPVVYYKKVKTTDANGAVSYTLIEERLRLALFRPSLYFTDFLYKLFRHNKSLQSNQPPQHNNTPVRTDPNVILRKTN